MTPQELSDAIGAIVQQAQDRITGVGAQQYHEEGKPQRFETMPLDGLHQYYREELLDIIIYAAMTIIRLDRIHKVLAGRLYLEEDYSTWHEATSGELEEGEA